MILPDTGFHKNVSQNEAAIRIGCFPVLFSVIAIVKHVAPRRPLIVKKPLRWFGNLSAHLVNVLLTGFRDVRYARFWEMILNPFEKG